MFKVQRIVPDEPGPVDNSRATWKGLVRYWDKAGTRGGGAYTVGALLGMDVDGYIWLLHIVRGQWAPGEREEIILQTAKTDGKRVVVGVEQEPGSGGKESAQNTARRLVGFRVKLDAPSGDKVARAEPFADQVNSGNVKMAAGQWNMDLLDELRYFPESTYKDQTDACSGAFNLLAKRPRRVGAL
jgi:predicted phage terminase large subunit-like protein